MRPDERTPFLLDRRRAHQSNTIEGKKKKTKCPPITFVLSPFLTHKVVILHGIPGASSRRGDTIAQGSAGHRRQQFVSVPAIRPTGTNRIDGTLERDIAYRATSIQGLGLAIGMRAVGRCGGVSDGRIEIHRSRVGMHREHDEIG